MPPKKSKKAAKAKEDDDYWEQKAAAIDQNLAKDDDAQAIPNKSGGNVFDLLDEEEEDDGGLMAAVRAASAKKDKKKKKKAQIGDENDEMEGKGSDVQTPAVDTTANLDEEWPEEDVKPKKGKKGKKGKKQMEEDDDMNDGDVQTVVSPTQPETAVNLDDEWPEEEVKGKKGKKGKNVKQSVQEEEETTVIQVAAPTPPAPESVIAEDGAEEDDGPKILSKAQKEKLKKEREKAKKKAQAAAKKGIATGENVPEIAPGPAEAVEPSLALEPTVAEDEDGDGEGEGEAAAGDKKKKKKKKPAAKAEPVAPAAAKGKKVPAHIAAIQAAMEEKRRIEEEARRAEEERLRKVAEEEARLEAEEQKLAEQKAAKKAKEKEKLAKAKAEGRLLTPAQKKEKAAAEARKQAMLASGLKVAGLTGGGEPKKVTYGNKKKPAKGKEAQVSGPSSPVVNEPTPEKASEADSAPVVVDEDDWDKSEEDAAAVEEVVAALDGMKVDDDDWDKTDDEEIPSPPKSSAESKSVVAKETTKPPISKPAATKGTAESPAAANGKPAAKPTAQAVTEESESVDSSEEETDSDDYSDSSDEDSLRHRKERALERIKARKAAAQAATSKEDLRSPICCIMGHVDTGKTKLLDKIRQTSVQEGEAGGITQQIGATFFPKQAILEKTAVVNKDGSYEIKIPGLLIIDTPGHESFRNMRSRGSSLCNIAILVVDITHGLEPQTIESLNLLRDRKTPFIVALNKIDRCYGWEPVPNGGFRESLAKQSKSTKSEFDDRVRKTILAFAEQGLNAKLFDENDDLRRNLSLVPTSAITGEGIPDMLMLLVKLTQERMSGNLMFMGELEATVLEVKVIEGLGTTIDVILSNGRLSEGDKIVLCGQDGQPVSAYVRHPEVKAALGVKISAPGLERALGGCRLYVAHDDDEVEVYKDMALEDLSDLSRFINPKAPGVWVQASTLGSLEALLEHLKLSKTPVRGSGIGPIYRKDILKAGLMLRRDETAHFAVVLGFDVPVDGDAADYAKKEGVKIFTDETIYRLGDQYLAYYNEVEEAKRKEAMPNAVWPVKLKILKAFAHRDPIILGVDIIDGSLRIGTPMGVVKIDKEKGTRDIVALGKVTSIEINHKPFEVVKKSQIGAGAAVKIERASHQTAKLFGRHFDDKDEVVSLISRQSIDVLKANFRDQVEPSDWSLIKKMKIEQGIP
ncbi:translation initiation factor aIF-2 [Tremella mesenterica]|uniref:Translation initiation factor aIF-2 n=1 Tax=Tremella mesenterica TaxID=5217 RepID=A0A4Q1BNT6_TREME|nr:translation initiation factor aIF-2 [Tremella mesenterica]